MMFFLLSINFFFSLDSAVLLYNTGIREYNKSNYAVSFEILSSINTTDTSLLAKINFYLGNIAFKQELFSDAIYHYKNSLRFETIETTKNNLILARKKLSAISNIQFQQQEHNKKQILQEALQNENNAIKKHQNQPTIIKNKNW